MPSAPTETATTQAGEPPRDGDVRPQTGEGSAQVAHAAEDRAAGTISWDLLRLLRAELMSLEERAKFVIPVQLTAMIGLWVQIAGFPKGTPRDLALAALAILVISIFTSLYLVRPCPLPIFWDRLIASLSMKNPQEVEVEATIVATLFRSWEKEEKRLRRGLLYAISLGALALLTAIAAYVVDLTVR
jgi:hypothetical protein